MGDKISLKVQERTVAGKKVKKLRADGLVPMVVYGAEMEPRAVQASFNDVVKVVREAGKHTPVTLTLGDKKRIAMVKEVGIDPAKNIINHVAFHAVKANQAVEAEVPIRLKGEGESEAEKGGLIILQNLEALEVKALPMDLPEALEVDITGLKEAGERVLVSDIVIPKGVEIVDNKSGREDEEEEPSIMDLQVASVWEPSALQAQNEAAAGDAEDASEVESNNGAEEAPAGGEAPAEEAKKD